MQASVIISYYKNISNLEVILLALNRQTAVGSFEVVISEDDNDEQTRLFIQEMQPQFAFPILHIFQEDVGFRKCRALNKAVEISTSSLMIFIDGDCVPHKKFVHEYLQCAKEGWVLYGRRVMLSEKITAQLLKSKSFKLLNIFNIIITGCKRVEEGLYLPAVPGRFKMKTTARLLGCNMAICKKDLVAINGFDEDYIAPGGGEDSDIEWRLEALGNISFYSMKFRAIVFHLYHKERFSKEMELKNYEILNAKIRDGFYYCKNGMKKIE